MFTASEFRRIARDKLRGHWGRSVLVTFIFSFICGISSIYNLAKNMSHMDFDMLFAGNYNDFLAGFAAADTETSLFGSLIALVLSIVVLLFSGALEMGLNKYYIDLVAENRQGEVSVIFSRFDIFLKAMGLNLFMALFIWLWSLLFIVPGIIAALPLPPCPLSYGGKSQPGHSRGGKHEQGAYGRPQVAAVLP